MIYSLCSCAVALSLLSFYLPYFGNPSTVCVSPYWDQLPLCTHLSYFELQKLCLFSTFQLYLHSSYAFVPTLTLCPHPVFSSFITSYISSIPRPLTPFFPFRGIFRHPLAPPCHLRRPDSRMVFQRGREELSSSTSSISDQRQQLQHYPHWQVCCVNINPSLLCCQGSISSL